MKTGWDEMLVVGRIARTHGLRGEIVANLETDFPEERFRAGNVMFVEGDAEPRALTVRVVRFHKGRPVVAFEGVDGVEAAEALGRGDLRMPADEMEPLPPGTYHHHQLVGCAVVTLAGETVGKVARVDGGPASSLLVVHGDDREVLVPLVAEICVAVEPDLGRIVVSPPEGLLDLNG